MPKTTKIFVSYSGKITANFQTRELSVGKEVELLSGECEQGVRDDIYCELVDYVESVLVETNPTSRNNPDDILDNRK